MSTTYRKLDFGLRGIIFSCYYSGRVGKNYKGKNPLQIIDYEITSVEL